MTTQDDDCAFCRIARGEDVATEVVTESADWLAFFPLNPATPGHTLVVPRQHVSDLWQVEPPLAGTLMRACIDVGKAIQAALVVDGMNLIASSGATAEQTVFHLHLHLVPRWQNDGFGRIWPTGHRYENADLGNVADRIAQAWQAQRGL
jgi:diadenosine tetraphosphate (Ap4A) HIT family hydrolase